MITHVIHTWKQVDLEQIDTVYFLQAKLLPASFCELGLAICSLPCQGLYVTFILHVKWKNRTTVQPHTRQHIELQLLIPEQNPCPSSKYPSRHLQSYEPNVLLHSEFLGQIVWFILHSLISVWKKKLFIFLIFLCTSFPFFVPTWRSTHIHTFFIHIHIFFFFMQDLVSQP